MVPSWAVYISLAIATFVLGGTIGFFVGLGGSDTAVLAAVLPVLLTSVGWVVAFAYISKGSAVSFATNLLSIEFLLSFWIFAQWAYFIEQKADFEREMFLQNARARYLLECSAVESSTNAFREKIGLEPLKSEVFCR